MPMLSARELPPVDPAEDRVPRIVHPGRWCQMHLAIASRYSSLDRQHVQYERSLQVPSRWVQASKTSFFSFLHEYITFLSTVASILPKVFPLCLSLFLLSFTASDFANSIL